MATLGQEQNFLNTVIGSDLLDSSIDWIRQNISPEEVYGEKTLLEWAENYDPDSIFKLHTLESWAESNGYVKSDES